ncbi:MAG: hypothetical protein ACM3S0_03065, partial [Acidobacteriota bacterium]
MSKLTDRHSYSDSDYSSGLPSSVSPSDASSPTRSVAIKNVVMRLLTVGGLLGIGLTCILMVAGVGTYVYLLSTLPSAERLAGRAEAQSTKILDRNGELLYEV